MSATYLHESGLYLPAGAFPSGAPPRGDRSSLQGQYAAAASSYRSDLDAANPNNRFMRNRGGLGGSANHQLSEAALWQVRETAYHMALNDDLPGQVTEHLCDEILGHQGYRVEPNTGDAGLDAELSAIWQEWTTDPALCDFRGTSDFHRLSWQNLYGTVLGGDSFGVLLNDGRVQLKEAGQVVAPDLSALDVNETGGVYAGVELAPGNRPVAYYFATGTPVGPYPSTAIARRTRYDEHGLQVVTHTYSDHRTSQGRGYTWWLPVMINAGMLADLDFALVVKAQSTAAIAAVSEASGTGPAPPVPLGPQSAVTGTDGSSQTDIRLKHGAIVDLPRGRKLAGFSQAVPHPEALNHIKYQLKKLGAAVHMPYVILLYDASETNFSGWRGAVDAARETWRRIQTMLITQWYRPIYRWQTYRAVPRLGAVARRLAASGVIYRHRWIPRSWRYIEPSKDANAEKVIVGSLLNSLRAVHAERGLDTDDILRDNVRDRTSHIRMCLTAAAELNREFNTDQVSWRDVASWLDTAKDNEPAAAASDDDTSTTTPGDPQE